MYLGSSQRYLDFNNMDLAEIDSGGPWEIENYAQDFIRFHLYSFQPTNADVVVVNTLFDVDLYSSILTYIPLAALQSLKTNLEAAFNITC